jgi:hypothetical protein
MPIPLPVALSSCRCTLTACQFADRKVGEPHWIALSQIDVSENCLCQSLA